MQLKAIVDCQIMARHPHMAKIIAKYDLLIYRYFSPVWNRNAEGKLQLEEEEDGGDDEDKDDEEEKEEDQDGKDKLDTGGLEKGEGVEIVVLNVVPKKKKKKEKDEEEKEQEEKKRRRKKNKKREKMMKRRKKKKSEKN